LSSDPPLFSSDDLPASSENYTHRRKKRRYPGTWWGAQACGRNDQAVEVSRRKREFKRAVDSGVWMGSEDTDLSADDGSELRLLAGSSAWEQPKDVNDGDRPKGMQRTETKDTMFDGTIGCSPQGIYSTQDIATSPEQRAIQIVQYCLDESIERVDLS